MDDLTIVAIAVAPGAAPPPPYVWKTAHGLSFLCRPRTERATMAARDLEVAWLLHQHSPLRLTRAGQALGQPLRAGADPFQVVARVQEGAGWGELTVRLHLPIEEPAPESAASKPSDGAAWLRDRARARRPELQVEARALALRQQVQAVIAGWDGVTVTGAKGTLRRDYGLSVVRVFLRVPVAAASHTRMRLQAICTESDPRIRVVGPFPPSL